MMITRMALPRRTFLRGVGATLALPLLDAMVPALSATPVSASNRVRRLGFVYVPNGVAMSTNASINHWKPTGVGAGFEFSPILSPLAPFRDQVVVLSGLSHRQAESLGDGGGDHSRASANWLSGVHPKQTEGADVKAATTLDQIVAQEFGKDTALPSLELAIDRNYLVGNCDNGYSCVYVNTISWRAANTPLPMENNPQVVFERLFGSGGTGAQRLAEARKDRSILDAVAQDIAGLQRKLGPGDRTRVTEYLDSVREVERRIAKAQLQTADSATPALAQPAGIPEAFGDHVKLMYDLQWLAYQADVTRVFTFMLGRELVGRAYPEIGVPEHHHGLSHHRDDPALLAKLTKINTYHVDLFTYFLEKLRATPDGDGNLLDHTMLLYGAGLADSNQHSHVDLPLVLVGGTTPRHGGQHLAYPVETPMANLLVTLLERVGLPAERYGDSTGRLDIETLADL